MRLLVVVFICACGPAATPSAFEGNRETPIVLDTQTAEARAQYDANVAFVTQYKPRCKADAKGRRVIITGFGRFLDVTRNTTALLVSDIVGIDVPTPPPDATVDQPSRELAVGTKTIDGVTVCGIILPVFWDVAAIILAKEIDAFAPDLVVMNGVAESAQPMSFEQGAINEAQASVDGSNALQPAVSEIISGAPYARPNLLSWNLVREAAQSVIASRPSLSLLGAAITPYPHEGNAYLCNNLTYVTSYLMDHPKQPITLLQASPPIAGRVNQVRLSLYRDFSQVPRVFIHWPSALEGDDLETGVLALKAAVAAQLNDESPVRP